MTEDRVGSALASDKRIQRDWQAVTRRGGPASAQRSPKQGYSGSLRDSFGEFDAKNRRVRRTKRGKKRRSGRSSSSR